jgi:thiamine transport system ATP-binding protein
VLRVRDLRVLYVDDDGTVAPAVDGVSVDVAKGEVVAILGPSGSGKSTLLRAVAGLAQPESGSIEADGVDLAGVAPDRRGVGLMFQAPTLFPNRDVAGNVGFGLRMQRRPAAAIEPRVAELLELVGLPGFERRAVSTLSGGEQQRVALARALAPEPRLLLLDEPFGALDAVLRQRLVEDVGLLVRRLGLTVVAVTHDREEAYALADRVVVLRDGRVVADGTPEQLWADPGDAWVAEFLGMPNVVEAEVGDGVARTPWGDLPVAPGITGGHVVLPPTSVRLVSAGESDDAQVQEAQVLAHTFLGDRVRLVLRVRDADLVATVPVADAPPAGVGVRVRITPEGLLVLR